MKTLISLDALSLVVALSLAACGGRPLPNAAPPATPATPPADPAPIAPPSPVSPVCWGSGALGLTVVVTGLPASSEGAPLTVVSTRELGRREGPSGGRGVVRGGRAEIACSAIMAADNGYPGIVMHVDGNRDGKCSVDELREEQRYAWMRDVRVERIWSTSSLAVTKAAAFCAWVEAGLKR